MSTLKTRISSLLGVFVLVTSLVTFGTGDAAYAIYCGVDTWATGAWGDNYYVSWNCDRNGEYTRGIQWIVQYFEPSPGYYPCNPGPIDGIYGSQTAGGIACFQDYNGLDSDGAVGQDTWPVLQSQLDYVGGGQGWSYYHIAGVYGA